MDVRCTKCHKLFFRIKTEKAVIEIKCLKCGYIQTLTISSDKKGDARSRKVCTDKA